MNVPNLDDLDFTFGSIKHMPKYSTLPEDYQHERGPYCDAVSQWFYAGASKDGADLIVGGERFSPKDGIDGAKALRAVGAILRSFQPKHEHKISGAGWLLAQWFDHKPKAA